MKNYIKPWNFIALIFTIICWSSCASESSETNKQLNSDSLELEKSKIELEKTKIELEKEKRSEEKNKLNEKIENNQTIALAKKAQHFKVNSTGIVTNDKAFFYQAPDYNTRKKSYLVRGDIIEALNVSNNFIYIEFYSQYLQKTSKGWIDVNDIEPYNSNY